MGIELETRPCLKKNRRKHIIERDGATQMSSVRNSSGSPWLRQKWSRSGKTEFLPEWIQSLNVCQLL